jgi:hypothetical protein
MIFCGFLREIPGRAYQNRFRHPPCIAMKNLKAFLLLIAAALVAVGCGGGGGASAASAHVRVFVTDNLGNYDHVWVSVKEVDLVGPAGTQVLFTDTAGKSLDLASLSAAGLAQFNFLGLKSVPPGSYTSIKFVLDQNLVLFPQGATTGLNRVFAGSDVNGTKTLSLNLEPGEQITGDDNLVVDFDLSQWTDNGTQVTAVVSRYTGSGLDDGTRHDSDDYHGTISNLAGTAPDLTFDLSQGNGTPIHVTANASTAIFNNDGTANPVLANGERVTVRGTFDVTAGSLLATSIKIKHSNEDGNDSEVHGTVVSVNGNSFVLSTHECDGFLPGSTTVTVTIDANTTLTSEGGITLTLTDFLAALTVGTHVEAKGAYDAGTNTLAATRAKLEHGDGEGGGGGDGHGHEVQIQGTTSNPNSVAGTFDVTITSWEGASLTMGQVINVTTNGNTLYKGPGGTNLTFVQFYAALATSAHVEVEGTLNGSALTATKAKLEN